MVFLKLGRKGFELRWTVSACRSLVLAMQTQSNSWTHGFSAVEIAQWFGEDSLAGSCTGRIEKCHSSS